ncbi:hypothetical protein [Burkholderia sp. Nafp2/4-1b]|uniref:hypothetical protein n=1 Tax=Burkholderia sp. Nafp2/4-1b TaxID=2116686 RepID=UPI001F09751B|nr:hypothetical protein [Burkholderia sp. Nafp2/4-1b]
MRAPSAHAGLAAVVRVATASWAGTRRSVSLRLVMQLATGAVVAMDVELAIALAAQSAASPAFAAAAAALACAIAVRGAPAFAVRRIAHARAAPAIPPPAWLRPFSSVRLTLMQDHSS